MSGSEASAKYMGSFPDNMVVVYSAPCSPSPSVPAPFPFIANPVMAPASPTAAEADLTELLGVLDSVVQGKPITEETMRLREAMAVMRDRQRRRLGR